MFHKKDAIIEFGVSGEYGRWILDDGRFLKCDSDHRVIGNFCDNDWTDAIRDGCISIHVDDVSGYMMLRYSEINRYQRNTLKNIINEYHINSLRAEVWVWDGDNYGIEVIDIDLDPLLIELMLTDPIAYRIYLSEQGEQDE